MNSLCLIFPLINDYTKFNTSSAMIVLLAVVTPISVPLVSWESFFKRTGEQIMNNRWNMDYLGVMVDIAGCPNH